MRLLFDRASAPALRPTRVQRRGAAVAAVTIAAGITAITAITAISAVAVPPKDALQAKLSPNALTVYALMPYPGDQDALRRELVRRLNEERAAVGAPPMHLSPALDRAAQQHVGDVVAGGSLRGEHRPEQAMEQRLKDAGYDANQWAENLMSGPANAAQLVTAWRDDDRDGTFRRLLEPAYADLGIGIGRLDGAPLYAILFAVPESAAFARDTAPLRDRERVRAEVQGRINAERRRADERGGPGPVPGRGEGSRHPLALDPRLDAAAQRHADDMLARSYFAHADPDGRTVRERAHAAGFDWVAVGENIAEGQQTVNEVVDSWMRSAGHRENILDRRYTRTGVGLALGRDSKTGEYRILWVQTFGLPR